MDMTQTFTRYEKLRGDFAEIKGAGPFMRAYHLPRLTDPQIVGAAWDEYQPAVPLNFAGIVFAGVGFALTGLLLGMIFKLFGWPFRRRNAAKAA